jgi:signal peptidase I
MPKFIRAIASFFVDIFETLMIALVIFLVVYALILEPHQVNGQSMEPNFQSGDYVLTDKVSYKIGEPKRGDVVVFQAPPAANCPTGTGCEFIKRIIGLPHETVEIINNQYVINSVPLVEDYLPTSINTDAGQYLGSGAITLGADEYFVSGDNRPYSSDSRSWGPITKSMIEGRSFFRYWPSTSVGVIKPVEYN